MNRSIVCGFLFYLLVPMIAISQDPGYIHPNTNEKGWTSLFRNDLSNAIFPKGIWTLNDGIFTASMDEALWSEKAYDDFILDLEFKTAFNRNSDRR